MLVSFLSFKSHFWDDKNIIVQMSPFIPVRPHIGDEDEELYSQYLIHFWNINKLLPEQTQSPQLTEQCSQIKRPSVSLTVS